MTGRQLGVDRVGLAAPPAGMRVGLVDLDHRGALAEEVAGQSGGIGAGRLDSDSLDLAEGSEPGEEFAVAAGGDREGSGPEQRPTLIERCGVVGVGVSVDSTDDPAIVLVHDLHCCPSLIGGTAGRVGGHNSDEALVASRFL